MSTPSEKIVKWLEEHHVIIKSSGIAITLGINKGNFSSYIKAKSIPDKYLQPIIEVLQKYGYEDSTTLQIVVQEKTTPPQIYTKLKPHGYMGVDDFILDAADNTSAFIVAPKNENTGDDAKKEETPKLSPKTPITENSYLMKRRLSKI